MEQSLNCACHLRLGLDKRLNKKIVSSLVKIIRHSKLDFDAIVCRGVSGLLIAPILAMRLNKSLIVIRKSPGDHSSRIVEGDKNVKSYIILDDFICYGKTVNIILNEMGKVHPEAELKGMFCYTDFVIGDSVENMLTASFVKPERLKRY